ncbi:MAG: ATP-binding cassette domain-containing protein [Candidatus Binataceae bacterium]
MNSALVEALHLRKSYGSRLALDDVSFSVNAGEVVGLLGPNGAGKTTTLSILATLLTPDSGEVRIAGFDSRRQAAELRRRLGFIPQSVALYPLLSAHTNLELFARVHGLAREARDASMKALDVVGLSDRANDPVCVLSGGMKRRLNLACGIVHGPEVLLLDEPTVGVDPQSRENILRIVRGLAQAGAAAIYSTHYMEEVERVCDRVLLIDRGQVIAAGTVAEIIALAGGQPRMEITFQGEVRSGWYAGLAGVSELPSESVNQKVMLQFAGLAQVSELLERARRAGGDVLEFSIHSPNLSDAFMGLTGHALRDPVAESN